MGKSLGRGMTLGFALGLGAALVVAVIVWGVFGLGFTSRTSGIPGLSTGVLEVEARVCAPGPSRPVTVRVLYVSSHGQRYPSQKGTGFGPFVWALGAGTYEVLAVGQARTVTVTSNQLTSLAMGYVGTCSME